MYICNVDYQTIMIKNILFDMGGVVFRQNSEEAYRRFREAGIDPAYYMGDYGQKDFFLDVETGKIDVDEFCRRMAIASGREVISREEAQYCWLGFIRDVPLERLHNLLYLKEHYHTCLLSNTNPFIMDFTRSNAFSPEGKGISYYFDTLFCSYEMKAYKPNLDIFLKALSADNMKAEETIFVDDSLRNIEAAESLGIHGLHVEPDEDWMEKLMLLLQKHNR